MVIERVFIINVDVGRLMDRMMSFLLPFAFVFWFPFVADAVAAAIASKLVDIINHVVICHHIECFGQQRQVVVFPHVEQQVDLFRVDNALA